MDRIEGPGDMKIDATIYFYIKRSYSVCRHLYIVPLWTLCTLWILCTLWSSYNDNCPGNFSTAYTFVTKVCWQESFLLKLDLHSAYWQFPWNHNQWRRSHSTQGVYYRLWEFTTMPYGLTSATQICQRGLDNILQDCKHCVDNYKDDCIVFSNDTSTDVDDLKRVLSQLLYMLASCSRGYKCFFDTI